MPRVYQLCPMVDSACFVFCDLNLNPVRVVLHASMTRLDVVDRHGPHNSKTGAVVREEAPHAIGESLESRGRQRAGRVAAEDDRPSPTGNETLDGALQGPNCDCGAQRADFPRRRLQQLQADGRRTVFLAGIVRPIRSSRAKHDTSAFASLRPSTRIGVMGSSAVSRPLAWRLRVRRREPRQNAEPKSSRR